MSDRLEYRAFDSELMRDLTATVIAERTVAGLARELSRRRYVSTRADRAILEWHAQNPSHAIPWGEVVGLRTDPSRWATYAAERLLNLPVTGVRNRLAEISRTGSIMELATPPWVLLAWASPLYRASVLGAFPIFDPERLPYDGSPAVADSLGGVTPLGGRVYTVLDREDVRRICDDLERLDARRLPHGDLHRLREAWETWFGGLDSVDEVCRHELAEVTSHFAEMRNAGLGLIISY